mgnify:CR=1 FL=1
MSKPPRRPPLGGIGETIAEVDRIREYGLSHGFIPTEAPDGAATEVRGTTQTSQPRAPSVQSPPPPTPAAYTTTVIRPAPTRPWQAMLPDYLIEELRQDAAREGTAQKVLVMRALRQAGYRVDDIDLQDLRRR